MNDKVSIPPKFNRNFRDDRILVVRGKYAFRIWNKEFDHAPIAVWDGNTFSYLDDNKIPRFLTLLENDDAVDSLIEKYRVSINFSMHPDSYWKKEFVYVFRKYPDEEKRKLPFEFLKDVILWEWELEDPKER